MLQFGPLKILGDKLCLNLKFGRNVCDSNKTMTTLREKRSDFAVRNSSQCLLFKTEEKENQNDFAIAKSELIAKDKSRILKNN